MTAFITIAPSLTTISGIDRLRITDVYYDAPEPPEGDPVGIRTCGANLLYLHEVFPDAVWNDPGNRLVEARAYRYIQRLRPAEPGDYERNWPFKVAPRDYQLKVFTYARHMTNIALSPCALGTGKSKMALDIAADKFMRGEIDGVAIVAPNGVHRQWINRAVPEHLRDDVQRLAVAWKRGRACLELFVGRGLRIIAFNIEAFSRQGSPAFDALRSFLQSGRIMLIVDESTRIKNYRATRTKELLKLRHLAAVRCILTGTPITKGLEDFFTQYQMLDPNIIGLTNWFAFRGRYCVTAPIQGRTVDPRAVRVTGYRNQEELIRKIAPVSFMIPSTVLNLPEPVRERRLVPLTDEQDRVYKMLRDQLVEDLHAHRIENPMYAITRLLRLQQVLCGRYYELCESEQQLERAVPRLLPNNRPQALADMLEDHDGQALIWVRFKSDIDDIVAATGGMGRLGVIEGDVPIVERERQVAAFMAGDIDYMILNTASGSTGLDGLQCCSLSIYYSNTYNREHRWQSEGRIYRLGQRQSATFIDLVVEDSVDELILEAYDKTADLARMVMGSPAMLSGGNNAVPVPATPTHNQRRRVEPEF